MPAWLAPALAGAGLLGNILGGNEDRKAQDKQNRQQREFDERMWHMTNEYNTPLNQRKRLEMAGYNPVSAGQLPGVVSSQVPNITPIRNSNTGRGKQISESVDSAVTQFMQMRAQDESLKLAEARTDSEQARLPLIGAQTAKAMADTARTTAEKDIAYKRLQYYDEQVTSDIENQKLRNIAQKLQNEDLPRRFKRDAEKHVQDIANSRQMRRLQEMQRKGILQNMTESQKRIEGMTLLNELRGQQKDLNQMELKEYTTHGYKNPLRRDPYAKVILNIVRELGLKDVADAIGL